MDLKNFNDKQKEAVTTGLGPVLVLAGAGSGKTRVLTSRIAYLVAQKMFLPEEILAITFTNKAAKEMQERALALIDKSLSGIPTLGTFHSVCARILRKEITPLGYNANFSILDSEDQQKVFKEVIVSLSIPDKFSSGLFRSYISSAKNSLQTPAELNLGLEPSMHDLVKRVYIGYQNYLQEQNALDFDDLIMLFVKLLETDPNLIAKYNQKFKYILVDEYQDTNQAQYVLLSLLGKHQNIFVVGDDAQSIYGFRGSSVANILNFETDFPGAKIIKLEQNYRSSSRILEAASSVIALNTDQHPKELWTENPQGPKVHLKAHSDERREASWVASSIVKIASGSTDEPSYEPEGNTTSILDRFLLSRSSRSFPSLNTAQLPMDHGPLNSIAVLYRTHAQSRVIEEAMLASGIPYNIVGGVKFYERKEIKDFLAYLRLIQNPRDRISLKRVINVPARGLGEKSSEQIFSIFSSLEKQPNQSSDLQNILKIIEHLGLGAKQLAGARAFFSLLSAAASLEESENLISLLRFIYKRADLENYLTDGTEAGETRIENVKELFNVTAKYNHLPWKEALEEFLEEVALIAEIDALKEERDAVTLMTLHSAKGLEFETVFFVGLEEGVLPHSRSLLSASDLAEEIRLAYVGITRAKNKLYLSYAQSRQQFGTTNHSVPSRILASLPHHDMSGDIAGIGDEQTLEYIIE